MKNNTIAVILLTLSSLMMAISHPSVDNSSSRLDDHHRSEERWWVNAAVSTKKRLMMRWQKNNNNRSSSSPSKDEEDLIKLVLLKEANRAKNGNTATIEGSMTSADDNKPSLSSSKRDHQRQVTYGDCTCSSDSFSCDSTNLVSCCRIMIFISFNWYKLRWHINIGT